MGNRNLCLFFMPIWAPGHIVPMVEAAKRLLQCSSTSSNSLSMTFLLMQPPTADSMSGITNSYLQSVNSLNLPIKFQQLLSVEMPAHFDGPEEFITSYVQLHIPLVRNAITSSGSRVAALVLDSFATSLIDLGNEFNIPSYIFHTSSAAFLALVLHLPILDERIKQDFSEIDRPIDIPGVLQVPSRFMPSILMNKKSGAYKAFLYHARRYVEAKGIIVNSSIVIEAEVLKSVLQGHCTPGVPAPEIYPMGPIVSIRKGEPQEHECVKWLDLQQPKSVIFLCFGSRGGFKLPQIKEMAIGLERSRHTFLWAIQAPCTEISFPTSANLDKLLPEGFIERTKGKGLVWPSSVPQTYILAHPAVGGFVTHCGWNSILESLWFGIPMIPWPLYAEQSFNAFLMVKEMGVALDLKLDPKNNGFVTADELNRAVRCLMEGSDEGKRIRVKTDKVKYEFRMAVEKGGTSDAYLHRLLSKLSS